MTLPANPNVMIYGANGYSGRLIAAEATRRGLRPLLAGRNQAALQALAIELGLTWRVFGLDNVERAAHALDDVDLVIHCAGPFAHTAKPMLEACLQARTHYLDITGEAMVFEYARSLDGAARAAGITICPGTGFDVIPTDCLARQLADRMPDATHLDLGFAGGAALSPGTAKTTIEAMRQGALIRSDGVLRPIAPGSVTREIDFGRGPKLAAAIPWGDVSTAHASTGIPNIRVFTPMSPRTLQSLRLSRWLRPLMQLNWVRRFLQDRIGRRVVGPDAATRAQLRMTVWGEVRNAADDVLSARVETPNGYDITTWGPILLAEHVLSGAAAPGFATPSLLMGGDWLNGLPGMGKVLFSPRIQARASEMGTLQRVG